MEKQLDAELMAIDRPKHRLTRMTVNLSRPVPFSGFSVEASITRTGRSVSYSEAQIRNPEGQVCASAQGLHILPRSALNYPSHAIDLGKPAMATPGPFPIEPKEHNLPAFHSSVETRYPAGENGEPGPTTLWLKTVPLLPDETPSPFQRICPLADCGNAIGRNADVDAVSFINPDLTVVLHRDPVGEWLGSQAVGYWEPNGIGLADALLFDEHGVVGRALQSVLLTTI